MAFCASSTPLAITELGIVTSFTSPPVIDTSWRKGGLTPGIETVTTMSSGVTNAGMICSRR